MREAIVVLGMHRSGTSMVSGILKLTGFDLGKNLWDPDHANAKGYFENSRIGIFNDHLLEILHANWHDTLSIPDRWWLDEMIIRQTDRFAEILREEFDTSPFLLFKDPRISVLLPFYLDAFNRLNIKPSFIINYRNPFEVAASIRKRDNLATSMSLLLWMDHTLKAELYTRDRPRIFVRYDQVLEDPLMFVKNIFGHFKLENRLTSIQSQQITEFVEKNLKHHSGKSLPADVPVPALVNQLYDLVCSIEGNEPGSSLSLRFDEIGREFYSWYRFYQGVDPVFEALLQYETTSGKRITGTAPIHTGFNRLNFVLECEAPVKRIIFNPCNQKTGLILHRVLITDDQKRQFEIHPVQTNAGWSDPDGTLVFESEIPAITYALGSPRILTNINFELTCIVNAGATYRFGIHKRDLFIRDLSEKLKESQEQLAAEKQKSGAFMVGSQNENKTMTLKTSKNIPGPVVIGGIGGSGTRVIAEILREVNFFIGNDLNGPLDNLTYTLLFKRRKWFYENRNNRTLLFRGMSILEKRMLRTGSLSVPELIYLADAGISMSRYGHNKEKDGSGRWPLERISKMFEKLPGDMSSHAGWGWKEPNSHLLITEMNEYFKDFKYIHTVRHGLDMAFSDNQQQLFNWGPMFGVDLPETKKDIPLASFQYWVKANRLALEKGEKLGPKKFLWINYDRLCVDPEPEIRKLFSFLEITPVEALTHKCAALPKIASTTGRFRNHKLDGFKDEELTFLRTLGFEI